MVTDEMIVAASLAGRAEAACWTIRKSQLIGSNKWYLSDENRPRPIPIPEDAVYLEYACETLEEAKGFRSQFVWRAGIEAALKLEAQGATKQ